ncbi:MAG: biosynthetic-type acetolactate synthase large subunit [Spirochaetales bacterium]|nr:biosynthetic-type acetolactate synthase large subunit [Spirochaetales bacterium]
MQLNGAQIVIECLLEQGVDTVFGYPGGTILNVYDELYQYQDRIRHILTSHEQGASHAADGYARATGRVGVCMATSGPGATNLITGIATAYMDSVPLVAITCNVTVAALGKDSFQEIDVAGVTLPITKHNFIVKDINELAPTMRRAFQIAQSGRPGPVLVDITKDVTAAKCKFEKCEPVKITREAGNISEEDFDKVIYAIKKAKKPVIFVGGGTVISKADKELAEFVEKVDAPVTDSLMGKGAFDGTKERYMGMLGMHGTKTANLSVSECDLLIAIGTRFSDRVIGNSKKFAHEAKIIHIDIDPAEINKNIRVDYSIIGDVKQVLAILNEKLENQYHKEWMDKVMARKGAFPLVHEDDRLTGPGVIEYIDEVTKGDAIITTDVGQHQMWAAQYYPVSAPRTFLTSGSLGTMGFGLPVAIGAALQNPKKKIVCISGDGSIMMNIQELATLAEQNLNVTVIVFQNGTLGMVYQQQKFLFEKNYSASVFSKEPDLLSIAQGFGIQAIDGDKDSLWYEKAFAMNKENKPCFVRFMVGSEENVLPFVPGGKANIDSIRN